MAQPQVHLLGYPFLLVCCTFFHNMPYMGSSLEMFGTYCYKKTLSSVGILPILIVYPSHTSSTYPQSLDSPSLFVHLILNDKLY
jgi:hypothetical protein